MTGTAQADCLFCRIVAGDVPATLLVDEPEVVAFPDVAPKADVHLLVVPRVHSADVVQLGRDSPRTLAALVDAAGRLAAQHAPDGHFRLVFNTGVGAGQSVFHAHGHVLAGSGVAMSL